MVDEEVPLRHVFRDLQPVDQAGYQLSVGCWLTKVLELGANAVEVVQVATESVPWLDGAMQLHLQLLSMIDGVILEGVSKGL